MKTKATAAIMGGVIAVLFGWGLATPASPTPAASLPVVQANEEIRRESLVTTPGSGERITGSASSLLPPISPRGGEPLFGTNYRANTDTQNPNFAQQEPSIAVNPLNPLNVVAAAKDERQGANTKHIYIYTSTDGGVTWINQRFPYRQPAPGYSSDPVVNFADDGLLYVTSLPYGGGTAGIQVTRSTDGGITFLPASQVTSNPNSDKEWTWIDNNPSSPYYHRVYVAWRNFGAGADIVLNYSTDRGVTWSADSTVASFAYQFPMPVSLPNGHVIVTFQADSANLGYARSTDGGATFGPVQYISSRIQPECPPDNPGCSIWRLPPIPVTAVNPANGNLAVVWPDGNDGRSTVLVSRSTDNGATWSSATRLAASPVQGTYQVQPWIESDEDGTFHAIWYDNRDAPETSVFHVLYSRSTDSGATWSQPTRISTASSDLRIGIPTGYNAAAGDYIQVTASDGNIYAAWTDTRSGTGEDIYVVRGIEQGGGGTPTVTATPCPPGGAWSIVPSQSPSTESNYLRDVSALTSNDVWAVGYATYGTGQSAVDRTLIQHWNGSAWQVVPSPNVGSSSNRLFGVVAIAPNDVWAVGQYRFVTQPTPYDQTLIMHWDGASWQVVSSPNPGTWNHALYDVDAASPTSVCAVGEYNPSLGENLRTLIQCWDGSQWITLASPNGNLGSYNSLRGVTALSPNEMWAAGYYGVTDGSNTLTLRWNGSSWTQVPSANGMGRFSQLRGIDAVSSNDIWAVGYNNPDPGGAGNYIRTLLIHWDGTGWTQVASPNPITGASNYFNSVTAIGPNDVWAAGYHCAAPSPCGARTFTARWNGSSWTQVPSPSNDSSFHELYSIDAVSSGDIWAVGYYGPAAAYRTLALHYTTPPCGSPTAAPTSTSTPTVRTPTITATATATATATVCGSWQIIPVPENGRVTKALGVEVDASNAVLAVGEEGPTAPSHTYQLRWNGTGWSVPAPTPNVPFASRLNDVSTHTSGDGWAVGWFQGSLRGTLIERWNGSTWTLVPSPNGPGYYNELFGVSSRASNDAWAVGVSLVSGGTPTTLIERWDGSAWNVVPSPNVENTGLLRAVDSLAQDEAWAVGEYRSLGVARTLIARWNGTAWSVVPSPNTGMSISLYDLDMISPTEGWAVGSIVNDSTAHTVAMRWNGVQWSIVPTPDLGSTSAHLRGVAALAPDDVWAVGYKVDGSGSQVYVLNWNGATWQEYVVPNAQPQSFLEEISASPAGELWAVGWTNSGAQMRALTMRFVPAGCPTRTPPPTTPTATSTAPAATATTCTIMFTDVPPTDPFYANIRCLACRGIVSGYNDGTFRPYNNITRGQIAKIVSNAAGFSEPVSGQRYEDVLPTNTFYEWIERLSGRGHMGGYPCGQRETEPCLPPGNRPYFRPTEDATRGQLSKIVSNAAGYNDPVSGVFYADVDESNPFYVEIMRLTGRGVMSGYPCGGEGEPCDPQNRPYFRWGNPVTRGQASKIVANTFYPGCQTR